MAGAMRMNMGWIGDGRVGDGRVGPKHLLRLYGYHGYADTLTHYGYAAFMYPALRIRGPPTYPTLRCLHVSDDADADTAPYHTGRTTSIYGYI